MRYLALDLGTKTLGLAISDKTKVISLAGITNVIASPYKTIRFQNYDELNKELKSIIAEKDIGTLILGYPKNMNNSLGIAIERTLKFKEELEKVISLPIILVDERLSTMEAENTLIAMDMSRAKRKEVIDSYAAAVILDTYLKGRREK